MKSLWDMYVWLGKTETLSSADELSLPLLSKWGILYQFEIKLLTSTYIFMEFLIFNETGVDWVCSDSLKSNLKFHKSDQKNIFHLKL